MSRSIATPTVRVINDCSQVRVDVNMNAGNSSYSFRWYLDDVILGSVSLNNNSELISAKNSAAANQYRYEISNAPDHLPTGQFPKPFTSTLTFDIVNRNQRLTFKVIDDNQISSNPVSITPSEHCSDARSKKGGSNKDGARNALIVLIVIGAAVATLGISLILMCLFYPSWFRSKEERKLAFYCGMAVLGAGIQIIGTGLIAGLADVQAALIGGIVVVICGVLLDIAAIILWLKGSTEGYRDSNNPNVDFDRKKTSNGSSENPATR